MNDPTALGPCADFEFDLVDLADGALAPERRAFVERHLAACQRCRAWQAACAALDQQLAAELPRPALSAGFDRELAARIPALTSRPAASELRRAADREYSEMLGRLRRGLGFRTAGDALATAVVTGCLLYLLQAWLPGWLDQVPALAGRARSVSLGAAGSVIAGFVLAWAVRRGFGPFQR